MTSDLPRPGGRVVVIRLRALGDCVLSTPAIHLLRQYRRDLKIAVVCDPKLADIFSGNPDLDAVLPPSIRAIRSFRPDLCVNLHGGVRSARLTLFSGAPVRAGYDMLRFQRIYNRHIPTAQRILGVTRPVHTAEHMASAMFYLGVPVTEIPGALIYPPAARSESAPATAYAVIHPMASRPDKIWPAYLFLELAQSLKESFQLEPVFIGGPGEDLSAFERWRILSGSSLGEIARVVRDADLFIGNDSGPAHLAAAVGTPGVVLFGPSSVSTWGPWRGRAEVLQARGPIESITLEDVLQAAQRARVLS